MVEHAFTRGQNLQLLLATYIPANIATYVCTKISGSHLGIQSHRSKHTRITEIVSGCTSVRFNALYVVDAGEVGISFSFAVVCNPLGFILHAWSAHQSWNVDITGGGPRP